MPPVLVSHERTFLRDAAVDRHIGLHLELCRSLSYPWLELVLSQHEIEQSRARSVLPGDFYTYAVLIVGKVKKIVQGPGDSHAITVMAQRIDGRGVVTFTLYVDLLNTPNPRIFCNVTS